LHPRHIRTHFRTIQLTAQALSFEVVTPIFTSWNQIARWLRQLDNLHSTAERARRLSVCREEDRLA
jgi:hypothetical protein